MAEIARKRYKIKKIIKEIKPIKVVLSDIPQIKEIYKSFWGTVDLYKNKEFKNIIKQNLSYSYKIKDEIIGYCLIEFFKKENIAEIDLICIKKEYHGYHLGKSLLIFCIDNCYNLNIRTFRLYVSTTNIPAFNLYKKEGFVIKDFVEDYYHDNNPKDNDAYCMILNKN